MRSKLVKESIQRKGWFDKEIQKNNELYDAIRNDADLQTIEDLIDFSAEETIDIEYLFLLSIFKNRLDLVEFFIKRTDYSTLIKGLKYARKNNLDEIISYLEEFISNLDLDNL